MSEADTLTSPWQDEIGFDLMTEDESQKGNSKSSQQRRAVLGNLDKLIASEQDPSEREKLLEARRGFLATFKNDPEPKEEGAFGQLKRFLRKEGYKV